MGSDIARKRLLWLGGEREIEDAIDIGCILFFVSADSAVPVVTAFAGLISEADTRCIQD